jgi:CHAT domain-containing protein
MHGFHDFWIHAKQGKAESLQSSQLKLLKSSALYRNQPNLWSAFVLYGRSD